MSSPINFSLLDWSNNFSQIFAVPFVSSISILTSDFSEVTGNKVYSFGIKLWSPEAAINSSPPNDSKVCLNASSRLEFVGFSVETKGTLGVSGALGASGAGVVTLGCDAPFWVPVPAPVEPVSPVVPPVAPPDPSVDVPLDAWPVPDPDAPPDPVPPPPLPCCWNWVATPERALTWAGVATLKISGEILRRLVSNWSWNLRAKAEGKIESEANFLVSWDLSRLYFEDSAMKFSRKSWLAIALNPERLALKARLATSFFVFLSKTKTVKFLIEFDSTFVSSVTWMSKNKSENLLSTFEKSTAWLNLKAYNGSVCNLNACEAEILLHSGFRLKLLMAATKSASFIGGFNFVSDLSLSNNSR